MRIMILLVLLLVPVKSFAKCGVASWYGPGFYNNITASGERFNASDLTAAHRSLPFGTKVRVTHVKTGKSVIVRINDRGPFSGNRVVDLSEKAAYKIGIKDKGLGRVCLERIH
jgi:rare lipoprotein A